MVQSRYVLLSVSLFVLFSLFFSLSKGSAIIPVSELFTANPVMHLRIVRTAAAFTCGGLLALAGSLMQLLLQNPLADPYALGISGGAALFTLCLMLLGMSERWLLPGAWLGSLVAMSFVVLLTTKHRWQTNNLLLAGMALACGFSACISFILIVSPDSRLHSMLFWLAGDLNETHLPWLELSILGITSLLCTILAPGLNVLIRGELAAQALGLPLTRYRVLIYLFASLCTAAAVSLAGCIGFIGLLVPHITRKLIGHDHRQLLPFAVLLGGGLLVTADTLTRTLFAPQQLPVGIIIAMLGVPAFLWVIQK